MIRLLSLFVALLPLALAACSEDSPSSATGADQAEISLSAMARLAPTKARGDVVLTRARFVIRDIKLHTENMPEESEFVSGPLLLELDLTGTLNRVVVESVPLGRYDEVRFKVHTLDDDDERDRQALQDPAFSEFAGSERYSMIIEGRYDDGNGFEDFTYRSDENEEQRSPLIPPLTLNTSGGRVNVTFVMDTTAWFGDGAGGTLDPRDPGNRDAIDENIERSIDIFEDEDEDGREDGEDGGDSEEDDAMS